MSLQADLILELGWGAGGLRALPGQAPLCAEKGRAGLQRGKGGPEERLCERGRESSPPGLSFPVCFR